MAKSGNHTSSIQWLYIMWNIPVIWKIKIGISGGVSYRRKMISESTPGFVFPIWMVKIPFAYDFEQLLHRVFGFAHSPFKNGSGKTEWFSILVLPFAFIILTFLQLLWWSILLSTGLLFVWLLAGMPEI